MRRFVPLVCLIAPAALGAQSLPAYVPINPVLASRSALYAQPYLPRDDGWRLSVVLDYANAIETSTSPTDGRKYLLDAELSRIDVWVARDLGGDWFALADLPIRGAHDGFLDAFLNWYHDLIGLKVPARNARPHDTYGWTIELPDLALDIPRERPSLGDLRLGAGRRVGRVQFVATVTLPTATTGIDTWSRRTVAATVGATARAVDNDRVKLELGLQAGYTPTHGDLAAYQRTGFVGGTAGFRWRAVRQQAVFATLFMQSASWQGTGFHAMDDAEVTLDFGFLLKPGRHWPALQLGMTEDLVPRGPAVDAGFTVGLHWQ